MVQPKTLLLWVLLLCAAGLLVASNGCGGGSSQVVTSPPPPSQKIQHVIVVFQENRTPDNLFQDPKLIQAGADIAQSGLNSQGQSIPLTPISLAGTYDLSHSHDSFIAMYDGGKMDGADKIPVICKSLPNCPPPNPQFKYINPSEAQPYFTLAENLYLRRSYVSNQSGPEFPGSSIHYFRHLSPECARRSFKQLFCSRQSIWHSPGGSEYWLHGSSAGECIAD